MLNYQKQGLKQAPRLDRVALAEIYDDHHPAIYRYIYRRVGEVETARDLAAEVFRRLLQALHQEKGPSQNVTAWLYRTAHNCVIDFYRRQQHRQHLPLEENLVGAWDDPVWQAEQQITAERVRQAIEQLTPDQQQVIHLKFLNEMSNQEVATILDKPVGAVKSLQHRALASLQRLLIPAREKMVL